MDTNTHTILLEWKAPSKMAYERSEKWYTVAGVLCVTLITYGILSGAWSMSVTVAVLAGLFYLVRNDAHRVHSIRLLESGIQYDDTFTAWSAMEHFWILQGDGYHELHIAFRKHILADLVIQTADIDPYRIVEALTPFLPQIDSQKEKILDAIIRFCKL